MPVSFAFPDASYSTTNRPSVETLKSDMTNMELAYNGHEASTSAHGVSGAAVGLTTLNEYVPVGVVFPYAGTTAPTGFLLCDGSAVSRTTYASLFAIVGTTWGSGDGSSTFNVPNYQGRFVIGSNGSYALGATGGAPTATIAQANLPDISTGAGTAHTHIQDAHTHIQDQHRHQVGIRAMGDNDSGTTGLETGSFTTYQNSEYTTATNQNTTATNQNESAHTHSLGGSGTALDILNPYGVANYIIKY